MDSILVLTLLMLLLWTPTNAVSVGRPQSMQDDPIQGAHEGRTGDYLTNDLHDTILMVKAEMQKSVGRPGSREETSGFKDRNCVACLLLFKYAMKKLKKESEFDKILHWLQQSCILLNMETPRVCKGSVGIFGPIAVAVLKKIDMPPEEVCALAFPDRCYLERTSSSLTSTWRIELPARELGARPIQRDAHSKPLMKALHITDVHVDFKYVPGGNAECGEPLCCRREELPSHSKSSRHFSNWTRRAFSVAAKFSPSEFKPRLRAVGAGRWGDYRRCDIPTWTFEHAIQAVSKGYIDEKIDYIIWTGDIPAHDVWSQSRKNQLEMLGYMSETLLRYFPNTTVYPAVGNHDVFPANDFPPDANSAGVSKGWFYDALVKAWGPWLPKESLETVKLGAYYTALVKPGYRIVGLNTNFCYNENWRMYLSPEDPGGMLKWLVKVLYGAEQAGERVHVIGHVPPGRSPDCLESWSENYIRILDRFNDTITGQFFGHTHFDEMQLFYGKSGSDIPQAISYICPSLTSYVGMQPAFRIYDIAASNGNDWSVVNHRTYALHLDEANQSIDPKWELEYDAMKAYNLSDLTPKSWGEILQTWRNYFVSGRRDSPPASLVKYMKFYSRTTVGPKSSDNPGDPSRPCSSIDCSLKVVCDMVPDKKWDICRRK